MIKNILAGAAAAGLALAPIAAQAGTRAGDSSVSLTPLADMPERDASAVGSVRDLEGEGGLLILLLLGGAAALAILVLQGSENDASPGTGG